mmetsp:Transcript_24864/g.74001  ORF Transcript_24864/g.74001 Transcript_24864/m.74001 type:complete len:362 (-) Transcript_24864:554-1639(-)
MAVLLQRGRHLRHLRFLHRVPELHLPRREGAAHLRRLQRLARPRDVDLRAGQPAAGLARRRGQGGGDALGPARLRGRDPGGERAAAGLDRPPDAAHGGLSRRPRALFRAARPQGRRALRPRAPAQHRAPGLHHRHEPHGFHPRVLRQPPGRDDVLELRHRARQGAGRRALLVALPGGAGPGGRRHPPDPHGTQEHRRELGGPGLAERRERAELRAPPLHPRQRAAGGGVRGWLPRDRRARHGRGEQPLDRPAVRGGPVPRLPDAELRGPLLELRAGPAAGGGWAPGAHELPADVRELPPRARRGVPRVLAVRHHLPDGLGGQAPVPHPGLHGLRDERPHGHGAGHQHRPEPRGLGVPQHHL